MMTAETGTPRPPSESVQPTTQGKRAKSYLPAWVRELPQWGRFRPERPDTTFQLLQPDLLEAMLKKYSPEVQARIREDIVSLDQEILRYFRGLDHAAKFNQNRYRKFQLLYIILATLATGFGAGQALALYSSPSTAPIWGGLEVAVAAVVTFLATIAAPENPLENWMKNRKRAEQLRREYFRYLANLAPYDTLDDVTRQLTMARRAADINRGVDPDDQGHIS
ncbi:DUF4231 domain-containing protein [Oscillatoria laete-virens NRMC-F 0139]|nr:DUF4231 domain-containing protein [Oscillatoria laete-virens]MDL5054579.1 DUF4231 domain-containing protein [Oscillatoria laete-virens NRMC-F 0139]